MFSETLWKIDLARAMIIPLGLSFATFRGADLLIKSWLGKFKALPVNKIFFYGFFPPVQAVGPIIEYEELQKHETPKADDIYKGLMRVSFGLIKVLLLAAVLQKSAVIFQSYETASVAKIWTLLIVYTWFFYLNFSGFSDLAIGIARLYGYKLKENFCFPYLRRNIAEFWNNWHMSLSRFAQRSAFVPLGGYRKKTQYIATLGTIFVIALWHDLSWGMVLFALYHGIALIAHRYWSDKRGKVENNNIILNWVKIFVTYFYVLLSFPLLVMPLDKAGDFYLSLVGM
jgi:D-alanyl-lipoteichoic acid acyltransferase DltB (MBOAT superfamily)